MAPKRGASLTETGPRAKPIFYFVSTV
jgi:hypothetical protein